MTSFYFINISGKIQGCCNFYVRDIFFENREEIIVNGFFLSGYGCKPWIWDNIKKDIAFNDINVDAVDWPSELTADFNRIDEFSVWFKNNIWIQTGFTIS
jgi:hypothetical protein